MKATAKIRPTRNLLLHACPRCGGDLLRDAYEQDVYDCLQCARSYSADLFVPGASRPQVATAA
jgi:uncharacterized protein (DUF983 family)